MRMVLQVLAPGVEHGNEADLGPEMTRVGSDCAQRFGRRLEQDGVHRSLVPEGDFGGWRRQGEDDVEIRHRQQFGLALGQPRHPCQSLAFRAMAIPTRIVGDADQAAIGTALDVAAEGRRPTGLDRAHDAALCSPKMTGMSLTVSLAVAAEDVRHFQRGHDRLASGRRGILQLQPVEWAGRVTDCRGRNLGVTGHGRQIAMTEQHLDRADVGTGFEQMGGKAVAERMDGDRLAQPCRRASVSADHCSTLGWSGRLSS
jgi:hypothetical protein